MNPDGLHQVWQKDKWQRKNCNPTCQDGIDLNRNYPIGYKDACGGSTTVDGECYRGTKPFSERETQTMKKFQEDRNFAKLLDFHSFSREVRINYGPCAPLPTAFHDMFHKLARPIANGMKYKDSQSCCMGGDIHYAFNRHGTLAFLVETGESFQPPPKTMQAELKRAYPGIIALLQFPIPVSGQVVDKDTKKPVKGAILKLDKKSGLKLNERASVTNHNGLYHLWAPDAEHQVHVTAPGYSTHSFTVKAPSAKAVNIELAATHSSLPSLDGILNEIEHAGDKDPQVQDELVPEAW